jgi:hypothetical protein
VAIKRDTGGYGCLPMLRRRSLRTVSPNPTQYTTNPTAIP